jgi:four helix bundle protein
MKNSIVRQKSYDFALQVIRLYQQLKEQKHFPIADQLVKSATSIGANAEEALAAHSKKDFTAKMAIASKEARETNYWIRLIHDSALADGENLGEFVDRSGELAKILTSIVKTSSAKLRSTKN